MSVSTGRPVSCFTLSSTRRPGTRPGPRYDSTDVRFALSNDALKISGTPDAAVMRASSRAMSSACDSLSMTQGPAMRTSGAPSPSGTGPSDTRDTPRSYPKRPRCPDVPDPRRSSAPPLLRRRQLRRTARGTPVLVAGLDEAGEEGMGLERLRLELRVELHCHVPRMA